MRYRIFALIASCFFLMVCIISMAPISFAISPSDCVGLSSEEVHENYGIDVSSPWCVRFARYYSSDLGYICPQSDSTTTCYQDLNFHHQIYNDPQINDWIFFDWENDGILDHVGVVIDVYQNQIVSIEGNVSDSVVSRTWSLNDSRIIYYGRLNYNYSVRSPSVQTVVGPVTPSNSNGLKSALISLVGNYDPIVEEYSYTNSNGYISYVREITPDYPWLISAGLIAICIYCLFRLGGAILCRK